MTSLNLYLTCGISFWYFFNLDLPCIPLLKSLFLDLLFPGLFYLFSCLSLSLCSSPMSLSFQRGSTVWPTTLFLHQEMLAWLAVLILRLALNWCYSLCEAATEAGMDIAWAVLGSCMLYWELRQKLDFPYTYVHTPLLIPSTKYNRLLPSVHWKNEDYNLVARNQEWQQSPVTWGISYLHHLPELHHSHFTTVRRKDRLFGLSLCPCHSYYVIWDTPLCLSMPQFPWQEGGKNNHEKSFIWP